MIISVGLITGAMVGLEYNEDEDFKDLLFDFFFFRIIFSWMKNN